MSPRMPLGRLILVAPLFAACTVNLVPQDGAVLSCDSDGDCPSGFVCQTLLERCISANADDRLAPSLVDFVSTPARVGLGTEVVVTFDVSEPLGLPPAVSVAGASLSCSDAAAYRCVHIPTGDEPQITTSFSFVLVDTLGNQADRQEGSLTFDFVAPEVTNLTWLGPALVQTTAAIALTGEVSAPAQIISVSLRDGDTEITSMQAALEATTDPDVLALSAAADLSVLSIASSLSLTAHLVFEDDVGNRVTVTSPLLEVDALPPETQVSAQPDPVTPFAEATFVFASPDADVASFVCTLDGGNPAPCTSPRDYGGLLPGEHTFTVAAVDAATNADPTPEVVTWRVQGNWQRLAATWETTCAVTSDHRLYCWGSNASGMLGRGSLSATIADDTPGLVDGRYREVSMGDDHVCGVGEDHSLWCWGSNDYSQLGLGSAFHGFSKDSPARLGDATDWSAIAAGRRFTCGLRGTGIAKTLWCWGDNSQAQIGANPSSLQMRSEPYQVGGGTDWESIVASSSVSCGQRGGGQLWCFGNNGGGLCGQPTSEAYTFPPKRVGSDSGWQNIDIGQWVACAARQGDLYCWGSNTSQQISPTGSEFDTPVLVAPGYVVPAIGQSHVCALRNDGALGCWGSNTVGKLGLGFSSASEPLTQVGTALDWQRLAAGSQYTCGVNSTGEAFCWGYNVQGQLGVGNPPIVSTPYRVLDSVEVVVGDGHACARDESGAISCWGSDNQGQLDNGDEAWRDTPGAITPTGPFRRLFGGGNSTCAITVDDHLWCWGHNASGQLGAGTTSPVAAGEVLVDSGGTPAPVDDWLVAAIGERHACGIRKIGADQGTLWCWGSDNAGQLGNDSGGSVSVATRVGSETDWLAVSVGENHSCGLRAEAGARTLWCWGDAPGAQSCTGTDVTSPQRLGSASDVWLSVAAGTDHGCAVRDDQTLHCWGEDNEGETAALVPSLICPMVALAGDAWQSVAAGGDHTCALAASGLGSDLYCWGKNRHVLGTVVGVDTLATNSNADSVPMPRLVVGGLDWQSVSVGPSTLCGVANGGAYCWGAVATVGDGTAWEEAPRLVSP